MDVRTEGFELVQLNYKEFWMWILEEVNVADREHGLLNRLIGVCGEENHFTIFSVNNSFL